MLYVAMGDGGSAGDPEGRAQDPTTLLGKLVRLDPRGAADADGDGVPDDNPFLEDPTARPEIWATGLRNPWRIAFDPPTGALWVADVGQNRLEEVNVVAPEGGAPAGAAANFGWDLFEGDERFADPDPTEGWSDGPFVEPVLTYGRDGGACSVTGGVVVRDPDLPALDGWYLFGDFCRPGVRALPEGASGGDSVVELDDALAGVVSFGTGPAGEAYVLALDGGVHRLTPA
jgi:glucose/arabinose dehydrogenase